MHRIKRRALTEALLLAACMALVPQTLAAQDASARLAYFRAVADYFEVAPAEVSILADWDLAPDEIPVALFLARRAGISPEALVALRGSGRGWVELAARYGVGAAQLHIPFARPPSRGLLSAAYEQYQTRPVGDWGQIGLTDEDVVTLVNVRVLSSALDMGPDDVLQRRATARSFVDVYARVIG